MGLVNDFKRWVSGEVDDEDFDMDEGLDEAPEEEESSYYSRPEGQICTCCRAAADVRSAAQK